MTVPMNVALHKPEAGEMMYITCMLVFD